jgi:hypothetical protein
MIERCFKINPEGLTLKHGNSSGFSAKSFSSVKSSNLVFPKSEWKNKSCSFQGSQSASKVVVKIPCVKKISLFVEKQEKVCFKLNYLKLLPFSRNGRKVDFEGDKKRSMSLMTGLTKKNSRIKFY